MQEQKRSDKKTLIFNLFCVYVREFEQVFVLQQLDINVQCKGGSTLSCSLLKKTFRWKMSFKIAQWNVNLDTRNDIDR